MKELGDIFGLIYDVALDTSRWPSLLGGMAGLFNCHFADSFQRTDSFSRFGGVAFGLDVGDYNDVFLGTWVKRNVWSKRRPVVRAGDVVTTREMVPEAQFRASEMYNEYLAPRDLHEGLRLDIWAGEGWIEDISFLRSWSAGPYSERELRLAHTLLPHLQRSAAVSRRVRQAEQVACAGLDALEHLGTALLLLDRQGRMMHANRAGAALLAAADGLSLGATGLTAATQDSARALQAVILAAAGYGGRLPQSGALRLPRPSGAACLALTAVPLRRDLAPPILDGYGLDQPGAPAVLVCVTDPAAGADLWPAQLTALFGLTPAEAAIAGDLLAGHEPREIAELRGRSINTVRTQLAKLMDKTGTGRQSELVSLLARLPREPPPPQP